MKEQILIAPDEGDVPGDMVVVETIANGDRVVRIEVVDEIPGESAYPDLRAGEAFRLIETLTIALREADPRN